MTTVAAQLRAMGYRVERWVCFQVNGTPTMEITDLKTAATVYMRETATLAQCIEAIDNKNKAFQDAATK